MFLKLSRPHKQDQGSALIAVIGVVAVGLILTVVVASSLVNGMGFTSSTRAGVQSQAAADAGIAAARAGLNTVGNCALQPTAGTYKSTVEPVYTAKLQYNAGAGWQNGCPTATTTQVRIVSQGSANAKGVAGHSSGDTSTVEAVIGWRTPGVAPSGIGMYLYKGGLFEANSSLDLSEIEGAGLMVKDGNLDCVKNNSVINGSVFVNGNLTFTGTCKVLGDAWVTGAATLGSGRIDGDLTAGSVSPTNPKATGQLGGDLNPSGAVAPTVPNWSEVTYKPSDWEDASGAPYEVKVLSGGACTFHNNQHVGGTISGKPVILDARSCSNGVEAGNNDNVILTSDVVIFANKFTGNNAGSYTSSSTAVRKLWFITPDPVPTDGKPSCVSPAGDFVVKNKLEIKAPVQAFLYSPCKFDAMNTFTWNGQLYTGEYSDVKNNSGFTFAQMGIAGVDLDTALPTTDVPHPMPGALVSNRDLAPAGP